MTDKLAGGDLEQVQQGLRMAHPPDAASTARESAYLKELANAGPWQRTRGFLRLLGPGYMQSAMTLGAGSAASSLFAGAMFGYELLWVAPLGMLIGVMLLAMISHQTLSTQARPLPAMAKHAGRPIAYGFAFAAVLASVIWHFPQYNLAAKSVVDLGTMVGFDDIAPLGASFAVMILAVTLSLLYGRKRGFVRLYERLLKWMVWGVVLCLLWVVMRTETDWGAVLRGFVPSMPEQKGDTDPRILVASGLAAAIGVNMVLLYPYSLLARGWGRNHRQLARWDLGVGMMLPYVLATALMTIAAANTLHASGAQIEKTAAISEAGRVLGDVLGPVTGRVVFDFGMLAMALSTITLHMIVCGFVAMEVFGYAFGSRAQRLWTLLPLPGVLAPIFWGDYAIWLAVPTTIICGLMLPVAFVGFLILQRSKAYLGADRPRGPLATAGFLVMAIATTGFFAFQLWTAIDRLPSYFARF